MQNIINKTITWIMENRESFDVEGGMNLNIPWIPLDQLTHTKNKNLLIMRHQALGRRLLEHGLFCMLYQMSKYDIVTYPSREDASVISSSKTHTVLNDLIMSHTLSEEGINPVEGQNLTNMVDIIGGNCQQPSRSLPFLRMLEKYSLIKIKEDTKPKRYWITLGEYGKIFFKDIYFPCFIKLEPYLNPEPTNPSPSQQPNISKENIYA